LGTLTVTEDATHVVRITLEVPGVESVERVVDVRAMPLDGRTVTLALSACELLRSLWPPDHPPPPAPPAVVEKPPEVHVEVPVVVEPPPPASFDAEIVARADGFLTGLTLLGADARIVGWPRRPLALAFHAGGRASLPLQGPDGSVRCTAFSAGLDLRWALFAPAAPVGLELFLGGDVAGLYVAGLAQGAATGHSAWFVTATAALGLDFLVRLAHELWLTFEVQATAVPRGVTITDGGQPISGLTGFGFGGGLGLRRGL
jgi:hypothetical protein